MTTIVRAMLRSYAALCALLLGAVAGAQTSPAGDAGGSSSFSWFVVLAVAVVAAVLFFVMSSRRRRRVDPNPPRP